MAENTEISSKREISSFWTKIRFLWKSANWIKIRSLIFGQSFRSNFYVKILGQNVRSKYCVNFQNICDNPECRFSTNLEFWPNFEISTFMIFRNFWTNIKKKSFYRKKLAFLSSLSGLLIILKLSNYMFSYKCVLKTCDFTSFCPKLAPLKINLTNLIPRCPGGNYLPLS